MYNIFVFGKILFCKLKLLNVYFLKNIKYMYINLSNQINRIFEYMQIHYIDKDFIFLFNLILKIFYGLEACINSLYIFKRSLYSSDFWTALNFPSFSLISLA